MFPVPFLNRGIFSDADAVAYFAAVAATGTPLTDAQKALILPVYTGLKDAGIYNKIDGGNFLCLTNAAQCYIDWKNPSRVATVYSVPTFTFTTKRGFAGDANTDTVNLPASISTGFIPSSAGGNMTQNSAHIAFYRTMTGATSARVFAGAADGSRSLYMQPRFTGDALSGRVNNSTSDTYLGSVTNGSGFFLLSRTANNVSFGQRNTTQGSTIVTLSTGLPTTPIRYLQINSASSDLTTSQINFAGYGGGLTPAEGLLYEAIIQTAITGLRSL